MEALYCIISCCVAYRLAVCCFDPARLLIVLLLFSITASVLHLLLYVSDFCTRGNCLYKAKGGIEGGMYLYVCVGETQGCWPQGETKRQKRGGKLNKCAEDMHKKSVGMWI